MVMIKNWLLRLFGLSDIVAKQAFEIDKLRMQCIEHDIFEITELWEPNDIY